jgi:class 3 adenylate cyclase
MGFGFSSVEHAFASVAKDIVKTATIFSMVASRVEKAAPEIEALTGAIYPPAVLLERAAFGLLGTAANAASRVEDVSKAKGLNIQLDEQSITELQQIARFLKVHAASLEDFSALAEQSVAGPPKGNT